jgi:hypothetical protein
MVFFLAALFSQPYGVRLTLALSNDASTVKVYLRCLSPRVSVMTLHPGSLLFKVKPVSKSSSATREISCSKVDDVPSSRPMVITKGECFELHESLELRLAGYKLGSYDCSIIYDSLPLIQDLPNGVGKKVTRVQSETELKFRVQIRKRGELLVTRQQSVYRRSVSR